MRGIPIPDREEDFAADAGELFFDLVFVFAFSQLVSHLVHHPTWDGFGQFALLLLMIWMPWSQFTWSANAVAGNTRPVRLLFLVGGLTLYLLGVVVAVVRAFGKLAVERAAAVVVLAVAVGTSGQPRGITILILVDVVLAAMLAIEHWRVERWNQAVPLPTGFQRWRSRGSQRSSST